MKNRKREICTSGSVRDEAGQPPHLLGRREFLRLATGAVAVPAVSRIAWAQAYPTRPITIVVPVPAGGPTDVIARIMAERMRTSLGQVVVVENSTGAAGGSVSVGRVARAASDGYTVLIGQWQTNVANGAVYALQYDVLNDFVPISLIADSPQLIVSKNAVPAKDTGELIAWLKANPNRALVGSPDSGSPAHIAAVYLQKLTDTQFQFVPYRNSALAMQDLLAGQFDLFITNPTVALPQVRAGKIRAYAVTSKTRLDIAPEIPTAVEAGLPGFYFSLWHAFWVPKGTPKDVIAKLNTAVVEALADTSVRQRLADIGQGVFPRDQQTPEALGAFQEAEIEKWWPIIKAAGIKAE
jgi:tripartite-type tricarboxylate transporter receptor subunit TctC